MKSICLSLWLISIFFTSIVNSQEIIDEEIFQKIRSEGFDSSEVMETASWITDVYGPRLSGSLQLEKAKGWTIKQLTDWGLENVHMEEWGPFGYQWDMEHFEMHVISPTYFPVIAYPKAWSPSVSGKGEVILLSIDSLGELEKYRDQLGGKVVFLETIRELEEWYEAPAERISDSDLLASANANRPAPRRFRNIRRSIMGTGELWKFLEEEGVLAVVDRSYKGSYGTVFLSSARATSGSSQQSSDPAIPQFTMAAEHYNRIMRMVEKGQTVSLSLDLQVNQSSEMVMEENIIAEITGDEKADEVVMFGAHFDSWHSATGATDNAAGSAVMMEVARILKEIVKDSRERPQRTMRLALWTGEEQGLLGSKAYVGEHFAKTDNYGNPIEMRSEQKKISVYYNLDNGTGKIRGIHLQGNEEIRPVFRDLFDQFTDLDASTITLRNTGGTDHLSFDVANIPAFQFIQDPIAYGSMTHHSNMDHWDHLEAEDLKQAAVIIASFVWHSAQREELMPRKVVLNP